MYLGYHHSNDCTISKNTDNVDYSMILPMANWMFLFFGLLVVIKTITRDYSQGTIQLYMNKVKNRVGYVIAKRFRLLFFVHIYTYHVCYTFSYSNFYRW